MPASRRPEAIHPPPHPKIAELDSALRHPWRVQLSNRALLGDPSRSCRDAACSPADDVALAPAMPLALDIDHDDLVVLCRRYRVVQLDLFGSRAKGTARPDSDVDLLVTFAAGYIPGWELGGLLIELEALLGRKVDLMTRWTLDHEQSPRFRANVLAATEPLYAA